MHKSSKALKTFRERRYAVLAIKQGTGGDPDSMQ